MQGFILNLRKLLLMGNDASQMRPTLGQYALSYQPQTEGNNVHEAWDVLQRMLGAEYLAAGLNGLLMFLRSNADQPYARVCFSADCEVGFEINDGQLCVDPHDVDIRVCCSPVDMESEIQRMLEAYDQEYSD